MTLEMCAFQHLNCYVSNLMKTMSDPSKLSRYPHNSSVVRSINKMTEPPLGSLMSPMLENFFREDLKEETLSGVDYKPHCWFHYIHNKFMIYPMDEKSFPGLPGYHTQSQVQHGH
jgi:hypothetical protein